METAIRKTKKELSKELWILSYPTMISFAMQSAYDLVDMAWVGQVSKEALSGVTLFTTIYTLFTVLNEVAGAGSVSMLSQSYGRGDRKRTQRIAEQTISFKVVLAIIAAALIFIFLHPILNFYTSDQKVINAAIDYGYIRIFFIPMMFSSYSVNTIFRCTHDTKTPMKIMLISAVLNLILDPVFMFSKIPGIGLPGLGLGVFGAALATVVSTTISFIYGFFILAAGKRDVTISIRGLFRLDWEIDKSLFFIGVPSGLQVFVRRAFSAIMIKFVTTYGVTAIALAGINGKLTGFFLMPIFGLNNSGATMVGSSLGKDLIQEAEDTSQIAAYMNTGIVGSILLVSVIFAKPIMSMFGDNPALIDAGVSMIRIMAIELLIVSYSFGKKIVFMGSGYNRPQLISITISKWFVHLPLMYLVVNTLHLPLNYFWISSVICEAVELMVVMYYHHKGQWKFNRV